MRLFQSLAAGLMTVITPALALAQSAPTEAIAPEAAVAAAADSTLDRGQANDPNIDRTFLLPTAQTQPKGSVSFNDYELIFMGLTYGVTNDFQITGTTMVPLAEDAPFFGVLGAKYRVLRAGRMRVAAQGNLMYVQAESSDGESESFTGATLGGIASFCIDEGCESLISASVTAGFALGEDENVTPFIYGGSIVQKVTPRVKLLLEGLSAGALGGDDLVMGDGALVSYGVRFVGSDIAGDIGFIKPIFGEGDDVLPMGIPFVSFTYRHR